MDKYKNNDDIAEYSEEDDNMNACAVKPCMPFVTRKELKRTPASQANKELIEFMDSHDFIFNVDKKTKDLKSTVKKR